MSDTATPAYRPTANCIWRTFLTSGKRHLLITGARGSGKTTLLRSLLPAPLPGITTWAQPQKAVYLRENGTENTAVAGLYDPSLPGRENKMVLSDGFMQLGISALDRCLESRSEWISIDEIGYLETQCEPYLAALRILMDRKHLIAVVRKQELPFFEELCRRDDVFVLDLDAPYGRAGCVIMASGMGKRFGGNKLMAAFGGQPMIVRALASTQGIFASRVVVTRHEDVAAYCRKAGISVVLHALPHRSDTIRLGLDALGDIDGCLFCPGDQPILRRETVAALALSAAADPSVIWRTAFEGTPGAPVLFPRWTLPELRTLEEGMGGQAVIRRHPDRVRTLDVFDRYELADVDTPEDLQRLEPRFPTAPI